MPPCYVQCTRRLHPSPWQALRNRESALMHFSSYFALWTHQILRISSGKYTEPAVQYIDLHQP